jgi:hypothetical protein
LTEYAIDLILALALTSPVSLWLPPAPVFPRTSSPFLARSVRLCQASLFLIVMRCLAEKHGLVKPCGELLINCDAKVAAAHENLPHASLGTGWRCRSRFCSLFTIQTGRLGKTLALFGPEAFHRFRNARFPILFSKRCL